MPMDYELLKDSNEVNQLSQTTRDKFAVQTRDLWTSWTTHIRLLIDSSDEGWQAYNSSDPNQQKINEAVAIKDGYSLQQQKRKGIRLGLVANSIDSTLAHQHTSTFNGDPRFFKGSPKNDTGRSFMELYEAYKATNLGQMNFVLKNRQFRLNLMIDGTAVAATHYETKTRKETLYQPISPFLDPELATLLPPIEVETEIIDWEGTQFDILNFNDWRADPFEPDFDRAGFIRRWYEDPWRVKDQFNLEHTPATYHECQGIGTDQEKFDTLGIQSWSIGQNESEGKGKALLFVRYDDFIDDEGKVYKNYVQITLNDSETIYFGPNTYPHRQKPYILTPCIPIPGSLYGKALVKDILGLGHIYDSSATMMVDIYRRAAKSVYKMSYNDPVLKALGSFEIQPGMKIPMQSMSSLEEMTTSLVDTQGLQFMMELAEKWGRERTGATPPFSGGDPDAVKGNVTAYQVSTHVEGAGTRFQDMMDVYNEYTLKRYMYQAWKNDQAYISEPKQVAGFEQVLTPNMIKLMEVDWTITATQASVMRSREMATYMDLLTNLFPLLEKVGIVQRMPKMAQYDPLLILDHILRKAGMLDADNILKITQAPGEAVESTGVDLIGAMNNGLTTGPTGQPPPINGVPGSTPGLPMA